MTRLHLLLLAVACAACSTSPSAVPRGTQGKTAWFLDTDDDGVPDLRTRLEADDETGGGKTQGVLFVDIDGDGLPDRRVTCAMLFVDSDGDGLPDASPRN